MLEPLADRANWARIGARAGDAPLATGNRAIPVAYAVFSGTHSGAGSPCPPTGRSTDTDYVYVMRFAGGKISHMTKIWNASWAMRELGWA